MTIKITTNMNSLIAQKSLTKNDKGLQKAMNRLSTGSKINKAKDDAAGCAIAMSLTNKIDCNNQILTNIANATNLAAIAENGMSNAGDSLEQIRNLCIKAANNIYTTESKTTIVDEIKQRLDEIDRLAEAALFNNIKLLNGSSSDLTIQIGINSDVKNNTLLLGDAFINMHTSAMGLECSLFDNPGKMTADDFGDYLVQVDAALNKLDTNISKIGTLENTLSLAQSNVTTMINSSTSARSTIQDADMAAEATSMVQNQILENISISVLQQANQIPSIAMQLIG